MKGPRPSGKCGWGGPGTWPCIGCHVTPAQRRCDGSPVYPLAMDEPQQIGFTVGRVDPPLPRRPQASGRGAQRRRHRPRRHGLRASRRVRLGHRDAAPRRAGRGSGAAVQPLPRHGPLLADQGVLLHRAQPPRGRDGVPGRHPAGLSRLQRPPAQDRRRRSPASCATPATPPWRSASGTSRRAGSARRPGRSTAGRSGSGFERYYGFLQGDTNHWAPNLVCDNHYIDPPRRPEDGLPPQRGPRRPGGPHGPGPAAGRAGQAVLPLLRARRHARAPPRGARVGRALSRAPSTRAGTPGATSSSHARSDAGVVPAGTVLTPRPEWVRAWADLSADERRMHARQQEVFAGFLTHTDAQIGRVLVVARPARG